jgi:hypothetical protein
MSKADLGYPFEHGEVIKYTKSLQRDRPPSYLSCRRGRKPLRDFTMRSMVTLKLLHILMDVTGIN